MKVRVTRSVQEVKTVLKHENRFVVLFGCFLQYTQCSESLLGAVNLSITIKDQSDRFAGPLLVRK